MASLVPKGNRKPSMGSTSGGVGSTGEVTDSSNGPAMAIIQNADLIDARLAMLAERAIQGEDVMSEQGFVEECQLIIAKTAFAASAGAQAFKDVTWVGKASTQISAMLNRRMRHLEAQVEQKVAKELRAKVSLELDELRQKVLTAQQTANAAKLSKNEYIEKMFKMEDDLKLYKKELGDQFDQLLKVKMEAEKARNELQQQEQITTRALSAKEKADNTAGELANTIAEQRRTLQNVCCERDRLQSEKDATQEQLKSAQEEAEQLRRELEKQRVALQNALHSTRFALEQKILDENDSWHMQVERREERISELEAELEDQETIEMKMLAIERECQEVKEELDTSRQYIVALMEASAKIGHFSMRTGGGYEKVGKAWEGLHRYIASTKWGKEAGLEKFLEQNGTTQSADGIQDKKMQRSVQSPAGKESGESRDDIKIPRFKVSVGPVFSESIGSLRPKSARKDNKTPRALSPTTPRPSSARQRSLSDRVASNTTTPRSVSIATPRTPRMKTPRWEEASSQQSPPRERTSNWRLNEVTTPRERQLRSTEWGLSVSERLQECAQSLRFESRNPPPKESRESVRGRREFGSYRTDDASMGYRIDHSTVSERWLGQEQGQEREHGGVNKAWTGLLKSHKPQAIATESPGSSSQRIDGGGGGFARPAAVWGESFDSQAGGGGVSPPGRAKWLPSDYHGEHEA